VAGRDIDRKRDAVTSEAAPVAKAAPRRAWVLPPRRRAVLIVAAVVVVACVLHAVDPAVTLARFPCVFHAVTGLYCPGCGSTRGLHALLNGDLTRAMDMNPLLMLSLPFFAYPFLSNLSLAVRGRRLPALRVPGWGGWAALGTIVVYWVLRNIPAPPFTLLAP
jgi:hypothetical protein